MTLNMARRARNNLAFKDAIGSPGGPATAQGGIVRPCDALALLASPERSLEAQFQSGASASRSHSVVGRRPAADAAIASARTKVRNEKRVHPISSTQREGFTS